MWRRADVVVALIDEVLGPVPGNDHQAPPAAVDPIELPRLLLEARHFVAQAAHERETPSAIAALMPRIGVIGWTARALLAGIDHALLAHTKAPIGREGDGR